MSEVEKKLDAIQEELQRIQENHEPSEVPAWAPLFVEALGKVGVVQRAVEMVGCPSSKTTYYKYKDSCPTFAEQWSEALETYRLSVARNPEAPV